MISALVGLLCIAYPVTILSVNMGELYKEIRLTKQSKKMRKIKNRKVDLQFTKDLVSLIYSMNLDIIRADNYIATMQASLVTLTEKQQDILICTSMLSSK